MISVFSKYPYILNLPAWQRFLLFLYSQNTFAARIFSKPNEDFILKSLHINSEEFRCLGDMARRGLLLDFVDGKKGAYVYLRYSLTSEGMKIVNEIIKHQDAIKENKNQENLQKGMFSLTAVLVITAAYSLVVSLFQINITTSKTLKYVLLTLYIIFIGLIALRDKLKKLMRIDKWKIILFILFVTIFFLLGMKIYRPTTFLVGII